MAEMTKSLVGVEIWGSGFWLVTTSYYQSTITSEALQFGHFMSVY